MEGVVRKEGNPIEGGFGPEVILRDGAGLLHGAVCPCTMWMSVNLGGEARMHWQRGSAELATGVQIEMNQLMTGLGVVVVGHQGPKSAKVHYQRVPDDGQQIWRGLLVVNGQPLGWRCQNAYPAVSLVWAVLRSSTTQGRNPHHISQIRDNYGNGNSSHHERKTLKYRQPVK
ncbi:hypothetical protein BDZ45DRAFT_684361 [Acephala macrosclerotiorum]|nr:hypothetical protein BDZ45DRAFT_684361 [Acephala macrosclerotiorum]